MHVVCGAALLGKVSVMQAFVLVYLFAVAHALPRVKVNSKGFFEGSDGRTLIFHGSSYVNKIDDMVDVSDSDMDLAAKQWGYNVARVGFLWNLVEPEPGIYNATYLSKLFDLVQRFANHGIYSILDMHQDLWSPLYCGHGFPSFYSYPYNTPLYTKDGPLTFPVPFARPQYAPDAKGPFPPITNCDQIENAGIGWIAPYATFALGAAAQRLYDNDGGLLDKFADFWTKIAVTYRNQTAVLGYEVLNEPWLGDALKNLKLWNGTYADAVNMGKFHARLHQAIRTVDNDTIMFFEPATGGNTLDYGRLGVDQGPGGPAYNDRQALSYHVYCPILQDDITGGNGTGFWDKLKQLFSKIEGPLCDAFNNLAIEIREEDIKRMGCGGLMTEFGSIDFNDTTSVENIIATMNIMDTLLRGWIYWLTDPTNTTDPARFKALARTYPQIIAGTPTQMNFNPTTGEFVLYYQPSANVTVAAMTTEIFASFSQYYPKGLTCTLLPSNVGSCSVYQDRNKVVVQLAPEQLATPQVIVNIKSNN